jgi:hypothetical protein
MVVRRSMNRFRRRNASKQQPVPGWQVKLSTLAAMSAGMLHSRRAILPSTCDIKPAPGHQADRLPQGRLLELGGHFRLQFAVRQALLVALPDERDMVANKFLAP